MVSVSLGLVLGLITFLMIKFYGLRVFHAIVATLFGFYLAKTAYAPEIQRAVKAVIKGLSGLVS